MPAKQTCLCLALLVSSVGTASAAEFTKTVFFGDSLSDSGAFISLLPPGTGRFTTNPGPVWTEVVAAHYGLSAVPSTAGGTNYAQGGARISGVPGVPSAPPTGTATTVTAQITAYLSGSADPDAFYSVWAGANDIFYQAGLAGAGMITSAQVQANVLAAAAGDVAQIARLQGAGARFILVPNMPNIGATPFGTASGAAATFTGLSNLYNAALYSGLGQAGVAVIPLDVSGLLMEAIANPASVGVANVTVPACGATPSLLCTAASFVTPTAASTFLFADGVHPTTATHRLVADYAIAMIEGPQNYSLLAETPVKTRDLLTNGLDERLRQAGIGEQRIHAFLLSSYNPLDFDATATTAGLHTNYFSVTVGADLRLYDDFVVGAAIGQNWSDTDFGADGGGYEVSETTFTAFGAYTFGPGYIHAFASLGEVEFDDINRRIPLGAVARTATSDTDGRSSSLAAIGGIDFSHGGFVHGPFVGVLRQWVTVDAFTEQGSGVLDLNIERQHRDALILRGGYRARYDAGDFIPFAQVSIDHDAEADARDVRATLVSLPTDLSYGIPAYVPDDTYASVVIGTSVRMSDAVIGRFQYNGIFGQRNVDSHAVTVNFEIGF